MKANFVVTEILYHPNKKYINKLFFCMIWNPCELMTTKPAIHKYWKFFNVDSIRQTTHINLHIIHET